jgi:hypothetical protein
MKATGRALALDLSRGVIGVVMTAVAVWPVNVISTAFAGPAWLKVAWPVLIGAPLALRRRAPLLAWTVIWAGIVLQAVRSPVSWGKRSRVRERRGGPPAACYRLAWVPASAHRACSGWSLPDRKPRGCWSGYQG